MTQNNKKLPAVKESPEEQEFKGYTLEELRYQRALLALRKEFSKVQLMQSLEALRPNAKGKKNSSSKFGLVKSIGSKVFLNLNTLDYIMLGMSAFGTARKIFSFFKRKK